MAPKKEKNSSISAVRKSNVRRDVSPAGKHVFGKVAEPRKKAIFKVQATPASKVFVAGEFNDWDCARHELCDEENNGVYKCVVMLSPGIYEYKFYINDDWCLDPANPNFKPNELGTLNSILVIE